MITLLFLLFSCADTPEPVPARTMDPAHPNVLLISIDTLRADHLGAYGYDKPTTPGFDALAADGIRYTRATSVTNWTLPAHISLMTGLPPSAHRVLDDRDKLTGDQDMLAQAFSDQGYATTAFTSHVYLGPKFGFGKGFDSYQNQPNQKATAVSDQASEWLTQREDKPFFMFLHYFDPHWNFEPPPKWANKFNAHKPKLGTLGTLFPFFLPENVITPEHKKEVLALYDGEIAYTDHQIHRLITQLESEGMLDNTIVIITADHGESFGEHGTFGHGTHLHNEVTHIPLIIRFPAKIDAGTVSDLRMSQIDIPRAVLELAGQDVPETFKRLSTPWDAKDRGALVSESTRWGPMRYAVHDTATTYLSSSWYQPLSFSKVDGKSTANLLDPVLLAEVSYGSADAVEATPITANVEALDAVNKALQSHNHSNPGYTLACSGHAEFQLAFKPALPDEIYHVSAPTNAVFSELEKRLSYKVSVEKGGVIGIPARPRLGATVTYGETKQRHEVKPGEPWPEELPCLLMDNGTKADEVALELSEEERALLEELGYIE